MTVITSVDSGGQPAGFACQAFAALSLDPPLVVFCPSRASATWRVIASSGHFTANVLAASQTDVARAFGRSGGDKFAGLSWSVGVTGAPVLDGVLTWAACTVEAVHDGGDHHVVIGRIAELGDVAPGEPLLFYRGGYGLNPNLPDWPAPDAWL